MANSKTPFLILTRAGFEDLLPRVDRAGAVFYLNPGVASDAELASLRDEGAALQVLATPVDPATPDDMDDVLAASGHPSVWIERVRPAGLPAVPARANAARPAPAAPGLRQRLARGAGALAGLALNRLRTPGSGRQLMVLPYLGFGNPHKLWVRGRVLDEASFREQGSQDSGWMNLVALYRRLESDEVVGAHVVARFQGQSYDTATDAGGYFSFEITPAASLPAGRHTVDIEIPASRAPDGQPLRATADVFVPAASARFGIISDIDDTVLWTNVTNKLNMALLLARSNAHTRKPFKGVAAFYRALNGGATGSEDNPTFYVSSSPWHLYGPLLDFLRVQGIPVGPLLLRELDMRNMFQLVKHGNHKLEKIELILGYYPDLQFVLIGDSGEQDPEIYTEVVRRHPQQVRMIYIRNVNPDPARIDALDRLIEEVSTTGVQLILAPDSVFAASHAAAEGLIQVDRLAAVRADKKQDDKLIASG
ncbi:App1 family protein [Massilia niastensis]|uniref:App1 family protein n=1 Tax=Massilia niastensis TaxID=544911 RepID=UPI00035E567A|nr:phosphatase domain-containing protein [Massilia niastensis]